MPNRGQFSLRATLAFAAATIALCTAQPSAESAERLYCFSGICLGDPPSALKTVALNDLSNIADRKPPAIDLKTALPGIAEADRTVLAKRVKQDGRFLVDQKTLPIFLQIRGVCAPIAPFVAIFTSDSGHSTAVEFDVIATDGDAHFGVKTITRAFRTKTNTPAYAALIADLSQKFGFKVGDDIPRQTPDGVVAAYEENEDGFRLAFSMADLKNRSREIASQSACVPENRVKID